MHDNFRHHAGQEKLDQAIRKFEVGPIMALLQDLQTVAIEVHIAVKVHLVKGFHWDGLLAKIFLAVLLLVKGEVVINWLARERSLLVLARRECRSKDPESGKNGDIHNHGEEYPCLPSSTNFPSAVEWDESKQGE
jgi:hypothetical protein